MALMGTDAELAAVVAARVVDRLRMRLDNAGADGGVRYATGLSLSADGAPVIFTDAMLDVAVAAATADDLDVGMEIKGRHDCEGAHAHADGITIGLRLTQMSPVEDLVKMIGRLHGLAADADIVTMAGVAVTATMPALSALVEAGNDSSDDGEQLLRQHGEYVHRAVHMVAVIGVELRLSSVTTLEQLLTAGPVEALEATGLVDCDAIKKAVMDPGNKRAVVEDLLRSAGITVTDEKTLLIEGLLANMLNDPTRTLDLASPKASGQEQSAASTTTDAGQEQSAASTTTDVQKGGLTTAQKHDRL